MKKSLLIIFVICCINSFSQCSWTITPSYTPASCSTCCDGSITFSLSGSGIVCGPFTCSLQPIGSGGPCSWSNLCTGSYTIMYQDGGCCGTLICSVNLSFGSTNISELIDNSIMSNLFPNPSSNILFVSMDKNQQESSEIEIVNSLGQIVLRTRFKKEIDVSDLPNGMYFLQLKNSLGQIAVKRLVIAR